MKQANKKNPLRSGQPLAASHSLASLFHNHAKELSKYIDKDSFYDKAFDRAKALKQQSTRYGYDNTTVDSIYKKLISQARRIAKNPSQSAITRCRKVLSESEREDYKPTISHYRDMNNGIPKYQLFTKNTEPAIDGWIEVFNEHTGKWEDYLFMQRQYNKGEFADKMKRRFSKWRYPSQTKNPQPKASVKSNPNAELKNLLYKVQEAKQTQNSAVYVPYLSQTEKNLIKKHSSFFRITDGGKSVYLSAKGNSALMNVNPKEFYGAKITVTKREALKIPQYQHGFYDLAFLRQHLSKIFNQSKQDDFQETLRILDNNNVKYSVNYITKDLRFENGATKTASKVKRVNPNKLPYKVEVKFPNEPKATFEYKSITDAMKFANSFSNQKGVTAVVRNNETNGYTHYIVKGNGTIKKPNFFQDKDFHNHLSKTAKSNFELFQGKQSTERVKVIAPNGTPKKGISRLGELKQMIVKTPNGKQSIKFDGDAFLAMDARRNLYCLGKDAKINNLKIVGNGLAEIGDLIQIDYVTDKAHIENGKTVYYYHKLGEVTGETPKLYIGKDKFPRIIGGNYDVWTEGIVN